MMLLAVLSSLLSLLLFILPSSAQSDQYLVLKRFPYMNWGMIKAQYEPSEYAADLGERGKRAPWDGLMENNEKRTSLKRLAILSARGFGRR